MPPLTRLTRTIACITLSACAFAGPSRADSWTFSLGAGASLDTSHDTQVDPSWLAAAGVTRWIGEHWAIHVATGDLHLGEALVLLVSIPEVSVRGRQSVDFVPAGIGLRFHSAAGRTAAAASAYVEMIPALYVSTWRRHLEWTDFLDTPPTSGSERTSETQLLAGVAAGAGYQWRVGAHLRPELAVRYHFSANPGRPAGWSGSPDGLRLLTVAASLGWAP